MEGYLCKKEEGNRWIQYWTVLQGNQLKFHHTMCNSNDCIGGGGGGDNDCSGGDGESGDRNVRCCSGLKLIGWIDITADTRCIQGKKKNSGYTFYIEKQRRR